MTTKPNELLTPTRDILEVRALTIRINLLESAFRSSDPRDEMTRYLLRIELAIAYKQLMSTQEQTRTLIRLTKVS